MKEVFEYLLAPWKALGRALYSRWLSLSPAVRKTIVQAVETGIIASGVVLYRQYVGHMSFDASAALIVGIQTAVKFLRASPDVGLPDYVNNQIDEIKK